MSEPPPTRRQVHVVDDEVSVLRSIARVLDTGGFDVVEWSDPAAFLRRAKFTPPTCVLLDVRMPHLTGPEVQEALRRRDDTVPVIFLTAHADVPTTVRAMKGGAVDFLLKPIDPATLLDAASRAMERSEAAAAGTARLEGLRLRLETLTARERDVFLRIARGASNKECGQALGIAENTVKVHRVRVMQKMEAPSLADLVRLAVELGLLTARDATPPDEA